MMKAVLWFTSMVGLGITLFALYLLGEKSIYNIPLEWSDLRMITYPIVTILLRAAYEHITIER